MSSSSSASSSSCTAASACCCKMLRVRSLTLTPSAQGEWHVHLYLLQMSSCRDLSSGLPPHEAHTKAPARSCPVYILLLAILRAVLCGGIGWTTQVSAQSTVTSATLGAPSITQSPMLRPWKLSSMCHGWRALFLHWKHLTLLHISRSVQCCCTKSCFCVPQGQCCCTTSSFSVPQGQ